MNNNLEISLEDIAKQLKDDDSKYATVQDVLDNIYGMALNAVNITSLLTSGFTIPDLFKDFKPSNFLNNFMPTKYLNVSKEEASINKYNKLTISNLSILLVSYNQAILENENEINEVINDIEILKATNDKEADNRINFINETIEECKKNDQKLLKTKCTLPNTFDTDSIDNYIEIMMCNLNNLFEMSNSSKHDDISLQIEESIKKYYYINLLGITSEFPEVKLWIDLEFQKSILKENKKVKELLNEIKDYQKNNFIKDYGFNSLETIIKKNNSIVEKLQNNIDESIWEHINAHHRYIVSSISKKLVDEQDLDDLNLPSKSEIFVPQSFKYLNYQESKHKKDFLREQTWEQQDCTKCEDIGKSLFHALKNPYNMNQPIIILGHPGAGKSMLSSMFASKLVESNDFVPFLIRLRDVDSSNSKIDLHIKEGILNTLVGISDINWIEWIRKFPNRTPVFILDGFDELLRSTQTELNNYLIDIKELQEKLLDNYRLNTRMIITSRLTIMEKVKIPNNSLIIKLNSFDEKRQQLWIDKWNERGTNNQFVLPNHSDIQELGKEPLLLFLLAVYDSDDNALSKLVDEKMSRSNLYDKLFERFTIRQLMKDQKKDPKFKDLDSEQQTILTEKFRLKIGYFAQILFLHTRVHHYEKDFDIELKDFDLNEDNAKNILNGFFFIHEDKSTNTHKEENFSFEFLHKTFGEFLAADFMLRIAKYKTIKNSDFFDNKYFRQMFAFQWINKQPKTLDFLLEHAPTILDSDTTKEKLIEFIQDELLSILDEKNILPLPERLHEFKTFEKFNHFAIYSQNLILLWLSIKQNGFEFNISNKTNNVLAWKVFVDLWKNYGGYDNVANLKKYIAVTIDDNKCMISKILSYPDNYSKFSNYANILGNDGELVLSYYESNFTIDDLYKLYNKRNDALSSKVSNMIIARLDYIYNNGMARDILERFYKDFIHRGGEMRDLSPSHQLKLIEFASDFEPHMARGMLKRFYDDLIYRGEMRDLSPSHQLKLIEFASDFEPRMARDILERFYDDFNDIKEIGGLFSIRVKRIEQRLAPNN